MAASIDVETLFRSAENEIQKIFEVLNKDKRGDKKWCETVVNSVNTVKETLVLFRDRLVSREEVLAAKPCSPSISYADTVSPKPRYSKNVVLVTPKTPDSVTDSSQTLQLVRSVTEKKMHVGVNAIKKVRNKGVLIELRSESECSDFVKNVENNNSNLCAKIPNKWDPRFIIHGMEGTVSADELVDNILSQNPHVKQCMADPTQRLELQFLKKSRDGSTQYAVIKSSPGIYHAAISGGKLYIGYSRCRVQDYTPVRRCYNCSGYGHISVDCKSAKRCPQCAEEHSITDCANTKATCANCLQFNTKMAGRPYFQPNSTDHPANSRECPAFKKIVEIIRSKTNYG